MSNLMVSENACRVTPQQAKKLLRDFLVKTRSAESTLMEIVAQGEREIRQGKWHRSSTARLLEQHGIKMFCFRRPGPQTRRPTEAPITLAIAHTHPAVVAAFRKLRPDLYQFGRDVWVDGLREHPAARAGSSERMRFDGVPYYTINIPILQIAGFERPSKQCAGQPRALHAAVLR